LAATRRRCLLLPRRDGFLQTTLHARATRLPVDDGGRPQGSVAQSRPAARIISRSE